MQMRTVDQMRHFWLAADLEPFQEGASLPRNKEVSLTEEERAYPYHQGFQLLHSMVCVVRTQRQIAIGQMILCELSHRQQM